MYEKRKAAALDLEKYFGPRSPHLVTAIQLENYWFLGLQENVTYKEITNA